MADARSIAIHVQVIDRETRRLTLSVPAYLPVADLTTRVARDAGLEAFWPDGRRRRFTLRARGRVLRPHETLRDLGVVEHELLHLLPEPPPDDGLVERPHPAVEPPSPPDRRRGAELALAVGGLLAFALAYGVAASATSSAIPLGLGGLGIGLLATGLARRALGPPGSAWRVLGLATVVGLPLTGLASLGSLAAEVAWLWRGLGWLAALAGAVTGLLVGWLAWHEAIEPLPDEPS